MGNHNYLSDILQYNDKTHTWEEVGQTKESRGYPAVSVLQLEILAKRLMDHLVGILAKLILAIGLLLVMDLCTFNLILDSMTNQQGTKEEEEKEKSCPNLVLASCIT